MSKFTLWHTHPGPKRDLVPGLRCPQCPKEKPIAIAKKAAKKAVGSGRGHRQKRSSTKANRGK